MRASLRAGLTAALKSRDRIAAAALRSALAAIDNAEAVPVGPSATVAGSEHFGGAVSGLGAAEAPRRELTDADERAIVAKEAGERADAAREYDRLGQTEAAQRLRAEQRVLDEHLGRG